MFELHRGAPHYFVEAGSREITQEGFEIRSAMLLLLCACCSVEAAAAAVAAALADGGGGSSAAAAAVTAAAAVPLVDDAADAANADAVAPGAPAIVPDREDDTNGALAIEGVVCLHPFLPLSAEEVVVLVRGRQRRGSRGSQSAVSVVCCKTDTRVTIGGMPSVVPTPQIGF